MTSVVVGNDLVCRLSFRSLCRLRNDVLDAISRARVNKMMIMQAIFKEFDAGDLMHPPGQEPDSAFKRGIAEFKSLMRVRLEEQQINLSLPGRIIHLAKVAKGTPNRIRHSHISVTSLFPFNFLMIVQALRHVAQAATRTS